MMQITFRYMEKLKKYSKLHKDAKGLRAGWEKAFTKLRYELTRIHATDVVLEAGYQHSDLRRDGLPYSDAKAEHGDARVSFSKNGVPMSYSCGAWTGLAMNVYMIALTLERLRAIDRYACTHGGEQYKGWSRLPPGSGAGIAAAEWASPVDAMKFLAGVAQIVVTTANREDLQRMYRAAAMKAHPDSGGDNALMAKVNRAKEFIEKTWGAS